MSGDKTENRIHNQIVLCEILTKFGELWDLQIWLGFRTLFSKILFDIFYKIKQMTYIHSKPSNSKTL